MTKVKLLKGMLGWGYREGKSFVDFPIMTKTTKKRKATWKMTKIKYDEGLETFHEDVHVIWRKRWKMNMIESRNNEYKDRIKNYFSPWVC